MKTIRIHSHRLLVQGMLGRFVYVLVLLFLSSTSSFAVISKTGETQTIKNNGYTIEKYEENLLSYDKEKYSIYGGSCLETSTCSVAMKLICSKPKNNIQECIVGLIKKDYPQNKYEKPTEEVIDAIKYKIKKPISTFDSNDVVCKVKGYEVPFVFAIGHWQSRKKPKGWSYASSILKAWIIDIENIKFIEVNPKLVKCQVNEDRN
jgi:hypothetical protein